MIEVIGVTFQENGRIFYFTKDKFNLKKNITVIVQTERGLQFGKVATDSIVVDASKLTTPIGRIVRIASKEDYLKNKKNIKDARSALDKCRMLAQKYNLSMQIIDAKFTFDRDQLLFQFTADNRVDFRDLAKDLAAFYRTRIELRQIGVRDKAKEIGGIGPCGKQFCCSQFLHDFDSVSINMAKNQNIALNPSKINGVCGRLLCCLKYEDETYTENRKKLPKIGSKVETLNGSGVVKSIDLLKETYQVELADKTVIEQRCE